MKKLVLLTTMMFGFISSVMAQPITWNYVPNSSGYTGYSSSGISSVTSGPTTSYSNGTTCEKLNNQVSCW